MDFNDKIEELKSLKNECIRQKGDLRNIDSELTEYYQTIAHYSVFDSKQVGDVLAELVSAFEGEDFVYQDIYYGKKYPASEVMTTKYHARAILAEEEKGMFYTSERDERLDRLEKAGKALIIERDITTDKQNISFYLAKDDQTLDFALTNYYRFFYVKEFIDSVISVRMECQLETISFNELEKLKDLFIASRIEQIKEHYRLANNRESILAKKDIMIKKAMRAQKLKEIEKRG